MTNGDLEIRGANKWYRDLGGQVGTVEMGDAICAELGRILSEGVEGK